MDISRYGTRQRRAATPFFHAMCERAAHRHWPSAACSSPTPLTQATTLSTTRHAPSTTKDHQRAHRIHRSKRSSRGHETHPHHTCRADAGQTTPHASEIHAVGDSLRLQLSPRPLVSPFHQRLGLGHHGADLARGGEGGFTGE